MAIYSSIGIQASVGKNGNNNRVDVITVQTRLNELMRSPRKKLTEDGKIGSKTIGMIRDFQKCVLNFRRPDSRVDPNGKSHRALNDPASESKWARMSFVTKPDAPVQSATPREFSSIEDDIWDELVSQGKHDKFDELRRVFVDQSIPQMKIFLGAIGRQQDIQSLVSAFLKLKELGLSPQEISTVFKRMAGIQKSATGLKLLAEIGKPGSGIGKAAGRIGKVAGAAALIITAIEVVDHIERKNYGAAAGEVYKTAMGKFIPIAGMVDGLQSLVEAVLPKSMKNNIVFDGLRAFDPIGLGGIGVDAVVTCGIGLVEWGAGGNAQPFYRLVDRMKKGPTKFFADIGEELGDSVNEMRDWREDDYVYAIKSVPGAALAMTKRAAELGLLGPGGLLLGHVLDD